MLVILSAAFVGGTGAVESCPLGSYNIMTTVINSSAMSCELCPADLYSDQPGATECTACPTGRTSAPGASSTDSCCAAGTMWVQPSTSLQTSAGRLVRGTELAAAGWDASLPVDYSVSLSITPDTEIVSEWANIIHFTSTDSNCCDYGARIPAIWFYGGSRRLHIRDGSPEDGNSGCDPEEELPPLVTTVVLIEMTPSKVEVFLNGVSKCVGKRTGRTPFTNVSVYASDPWHDAAEATIDNIFILGKFEPYACSLCDPGTYDHDADAASPCEICPADTYQDQPGATGCTACPVGLTSMPGSSSLDACCPAGNIGSQVIMLTLRPGHLRP